MKFITAILILCSFERFQAQETCVPLVDAPSCGCTCSDGKVIDLRNVGKLDGKPAFSTNSSDFVYTYNPCYPYTSGPGCADIAGCQQTKYQDHSLGSQMDVKFYMVDGDVVIHYTGGFADRSFEVTLKCPDGEYIFAYNGENPALHYRFTLATSWACPDFYKADGGSDPGAI